MSRPPIVITQGEHAVSGDPETVISTLLGSCVACCLHDPVAKVGGMNHILISDSARLDDRFLAQALSLMARLIQDLLKLGATRTGLYAKVFGGARMVTGLSDIGQANGDFVL